MPQKFEAEKHSSASPTLTTAQAAKFLNRSARTLRGWACGAATAPAGIKPVRLGSRLHWPLAQLEQALGLHSDGNA